MRGRTPLVRVEGILNQHKYIDILHNHHLLFVEAKHGGTSNFKLLDDNCGPHRDRAARSYMALHELERVDWAPQSPDMNPIENVWSVLERRLRARPTPPTTLDMLFDAFCEEWDRLPDSLFAGFSPTTTPRSPSTTTTTKPHPPTTTPYPPTMTAPPPTSMPTTTPP